VPEHAAPSIAGDQSDDEQPAASAHVPESAGPGWGPAFRLGHAQARGSRARPAPVAPSIAPVSAVLDERPASQGLLRRVVAKMRGR
jgi:hypothetical protein